MICSTLLQEEAIHVNDAIRKSSNLQTSLENTHSRKMCVSKYDGHEAVPYVVFGGPKTTVGGQAIVFGGSNSTAMKLSYLATKNDRLQRSYLVGVNLPTFFVVPLPFFSISSLFRILHCFM